MDLKKIISESSLQIQDISSQSTYDIKSLPTNKYFILHHTAGRSSASGVVDILNKRGLGIQWVIDRSGIVYKTLPSGSKGAHVKSFGRSAPKDLSNSSSQGVEIVASDDSDILIKQCKSADYLAKSLGFPLSNIYGHGEVSTNKSLTEGSTCKAYFKKYWNTDESSLPEVDTTLNKNLPEDPTKKEDPKLTKPDDEKVKSTEPEKSTEIKKSTEPEKSTETTKTKEPSDVDSGISSLLEPLGFLFKEAESKKLNEEVNRMKQLFQYKK